MVALSLGFAGSRFARAVVKGDTTPSTTGIDSMAENFDPYHKWLGIAPEEQPPNHYRLLGLNVFESDPDVIENGADRQMTHLRSFQHGSRVSDCQELLNEVASARVVLLNAENKAAYDSGLRNLTTPDVLPPSAPTAAPLTPVDLYGSSSTDWLPPSAPTAVPLAPADLYGSSSTAQSTPVAASSPSAPVIRTPRRRKRSSNFIGYLVFGGILIGVLVCLYVLSIALRMAGGS